MMNLSDREQNLLKILALFLIGVIAYFFIIEPLINYKSGMQDEYKSNISRLKELDRLYEEYERIRNLKLNLTRNLASTKGITALIEDIVNSLNIKRHLTQNDSNPGSSRKNMKKMINNVKLEGIDIQSALRFIYRMENSNRNVHISTMRIQQAIKSRNTYDLRITFVSYTLKQ